MRELERKPAKNPETPTTRTRRWLLVAMLAMATLAMHAVLTGATPREGDLTPSRDAIDFHLPPASTAPERVTTTATDAAAGAVMAPPEAARAASGPVTVSAKLDRGAVLAGSDGRLYAEVVFEAEPSKVRRRLPTDLVVVLDHSGSMSGRKLEQAKQATIDLISRLDEGDTFALVTFAGSSRTAIERAHALPRQKVHWREVVGRIGTGGSTDMVGGLESALGVLRRRGEQQRPCRILLLSDGRPDSAAGLDGQARQISRLGAALSAVGIGEDFNEVLMGNLADLGTGNYYFLDPASLNDHDTIAAVFAGELAAGRGTLARDLRIAFSPRPGVRLLDAAGYPLERAGATTYIRPGHLFAGQTRSLWLSLEVDAGRPYEARPLGDLEISWSAGRERQVHQLGAPLRIASVADEEHYYAAVDAETWGRAVVSEQYGRLQNEVADLVRSGRRDEARRTVESYVARQSRQNAYLMNEEVASNLESIESLEAQIDDAFTGADQAQKQKLLSKRRHELSQQLRRID